MVVALVTGMVIMMTVHDVVMMIMALMMGMKKMDNNLIIYFSKDTKKVRSFEN